MINTFEDLAEIVANGFKEAMKEDGFDTFKEMSDCYWWTTDDIKAEVDWYLKNATEGDACISDDGVDVFFHGTDMVMSYRKFSIMWHKLLNNKEVR